ncbi:reverse transcriptase domain-containing protein [Tanacetum coccineum]
MHRKQDFRWSREAEEAFQKLKQHLQSLLALTVLIPGETLTLYLAVSLEKISSLLMAERENDQRPVYFVNKALQGPEMNYPLLEKLAKWAIELGEHDISYKPPSTVKGQIIVDFLAECPNNTYHGELKKMMKTVPEPQDKPLVWTLYNDGASSNEGAGAALILTDPGGK